MTTTPTYRRGRKGVKVPLHSIINVLEAIHELGHTSQFKDAAKEQGAFVTLDPSTVNFIKDYLHTNKLHEQHELAKQVVFSTPPSPDPDHCPLEA